jgi:hypothetical protein
MKYNHWTPDSHQDFLSDDAKAEAILLNGPRDEKTALRRRDPRLCQRVYDERIATNLLLPEIRKIALGRFIQLACEKYDTTR